MSIQLGLRLFAEEFQGNVHGPVAEARFTQRLTEEGIIESSERETASFGRKWRSVLVKLGFATDGKKQAMIGELTKQKPKLHLKGLKYELTPVGQRLLDADTLGAIQDVFLRQLVRHELPSPIEGAFPLTGQMKPFIYLLQVLNKLREQKEEGLNKTEVATFLQLFVNHTNEAVEQTVQYVLQFRRQRDERNGQVAKREFDALQLQKAAELGGVASSTLIDYADTTFRYTQMTGLVTLRGSRLVLRENRTSIIDALLVGEPTFLAKKAPLDYLEDFYSGTSLPTDDLVFALGEVQRLSTEVKKYGKEPQFDTTTLSQNSTIQEVEQVRYRLLQQLGWAKEEEFADKQAEEAFLQEIIQYLESLKTSTKSSEMGIVDRPAYLEWAIWRGFLAINHITIEIHKTRRFPLDEDLNPRHPAPGGGADMIFEFEDYILVVEVTLTSSSRQEAAEGEPVRRHIANVKETAIKDVYGVFIAPTIDNNTAETFRIGVWYRGDQEDYVNIVPFTLEQFQQMIKTLLNRRYTPKDMQQLMDRCLAYRNTRAPEWKRMIAIETNRWIQQLH